jgi:predicted permease
VRLLQDVRFAVRLLVKNRWVTIVSAVVLALGIGSTSAMFTFVNAILLRGLPFPDADRIVAVGSRDARNRNLGVAYYDFLDWQTSSRSFSDMTLMASPPFNVGDEGKAPDRYSGAYVSANMFRLIGEQAVLGRAFIPEDDLDGAPPVVLLGYNIWQSRYAGDRAVLGRTIRVNDLPATVVGVMRPGMQFPPNTDLWLPFGTATIMRGQTRLARNYNVIARLADGVSIPQARSELASIASRLASDYPQTNKDIVPTVVPYNERVGGSRIRLVLSALMGAVGFVLLIACANVANLQLARAAERAKEVGVRVSLGASRLRVIGQLLVESVLLACLGGALSVPVALAGIRVFDSVTQNVGKPYFMEFTLDPIVFLFFAAVCLATGVAFGLAPALHVSKTSLNEVLKEGGRSGSSGVRARRWTSALLVTQVALTLVLLAGAGFMMRSFLTLYTIDTVVDTSRLLTMQLSLNDRKYPTPEKRNSFVRQLDERLSGITRPEAVTTASHWPLGGGMGLQLAIEGRTDPNSRPPMVTMVSVGARYFDAIRLPIVRGRKFDGTDDNPGQAGAIVNQRFVDVYFKQEEPLGRQIRLTVEADAGQAGADLPPLTIVGVSATVRQREIEGAEPDAVVYVPYVASTFLARAFAVIVRTSGDQAAVVPLVRQAVYELDSEIPVFNVRTMDEVMAQQRFGHRVFGGMFVVFAIVALVLAAVGLYAVTAYSVAQRTQEIGLRLVLGAQPGEVVWLFLRRALVLVAVGLVIGLAGAFGVGQVLQSLLVGTSARDVSVLFSIAFVMMVVAAAACAWPARRATRLDPAAALRYE